MKHLKIDFGTFSSTEVTITPVTEYGKAALQCFAGAAAVSMTVQKSAAPEWTAKLEDEAEALEAAKVEEDQLAVKSAASRDEDIQKQRAYALRLAREIVSALEADTLEATTRPTWGKLAQLEILGRELQKSSRRVVRR